MGSLLAEKSSFAKMQSFRSLELLNLSLIQEVNQQPFGVDYGRLDNGLVYYVRCNPKPRTRAALALAVKVGLVFYVLVFFPPFFRGFSFFDLCWCGCMFVTISVIWELNFMDSFVSFLLKLKQEKSLKAKH